jgi:hypothetical protein
VPGWRNEGMGRAVAAVWAAFLGESQLLRLRATSQRTSLLPFALLVAPEATRSSDPVHTGKETHSLLSKCALDLNPTNDVTMQYFECYITSLTWQCYNILKWEAHYSMHRSMFMMNRNQRGGGGKSDDYFSRNTV